MTINSDHLDQLGEAMKRFADSHWANEPFADAATIHTSNRVEQDDRTYLLALAVQAVATEIRELRLALTADNVTDMPAPELELSPGQVWALSILNQESGQMSRRTFLSRSGGQFRLTIGDVTNTVVSHAEFTSLAQAGLIRCHDSMLWFTSDAGRHALHSYGVAS